MSKNWCKDDNCGAKKRLAATSLTAQEQFRELFACVSCGRIWRRFYTAQTINESDCFVCYESELKEQQNERAN